MNLLDQETLARARELLRRYVLHNDVDGADQRAFEAYAREHLRRTSLRVMFILAVTVVAVWPFDALLFPGNSTLLAEFAAWRPLIAGLVLMAAVVFLVVPRPLGFPVTVAFAGAGMYLSALRFVPHGGMESPFPWVSYPFYFMLVPMLVPLPHRIAAAVALPACFTAGLLAAAPGSTSHPYFRFFLVAGVLVEFANVVFGQMVYHLARRAFLQRLALENHAAKLKEANDKSERLLLNILPAPIAERLKDSPEHIADRFSEVTVLFADICGFTPLAESMPPERLVGLLNDVFTRFDALVEKHGLEKIKTIGDAYMVAGGLPEQRPDHARAVAELALEMLAVTASMRADGGRPIRMRMGIHSGAAVAGVIGRRKFSYDLWGDTVNTASRMESHGVVDGITVSEETRALLGEGFEFEDLGLAQIKGKGELRRYRLLGRRAAALAGGAAA